MKATIYLTLVFSVIALLPEMRGNITSATTRSGTQSNTIHIHHHAPSVPLAYPTKWAFISLPGGLTPLLTSESGVVLLHDDTSFYRWKAGILEAIHPYPPYPSSQWVNPADGRTYTGGAISWFINAKGDIAICWRFNAFWTQDNREHFGTVNWVKTWAPHETTPREIIPPSFTYWVLDFRWNRRYLHSTIAELKGLDDSGSVWVVQGLEVVSLSADVQRLRQGVVRIDPTNAVFPTVFQQPNVVNGTFEFRGVNGAGVGIGYTAIGTTRTYFMGDTQVDFQPLYINKNGWVFGIAFGTGRIVRAPDGSRELAPVDGTVTWIDDLDRVNGYYYQSGMRNAVWVRKKDSNGQLISPAQYQRLDYVPMSPPAPWTTNHEVAPGARSLQLGLMTRTDGSGTTSPFLAFPAELAVDGNRDGEIKLSHESASDQTTADLPYRFWINDDDDESESYGSYNSKDRLPLQQADWSNHLIDGPRDLEDFTRMWISVAGQVEAFRSGNLKLALQWQNTTDTNPAIKLYSHVDPDGSLGYLTDQTKASQQLNGSLPVRDTSGQHNGYLVEGGVPFVLPQTLFANLSDHAPQIFFLFEGCSAGKGHLQLLILDQSGQTTVAGGVWLDLKNVKSMYERAVATTGGPRSENGIDYTIPVPTNYTGPDPNNIPHPAMGWQSNELGFPFQPDPQESRTYIIYVHGWRWSPETATNRTETVFKRLWHAGYHGRLAALRWPTFYGGPDDEDSSIWPTPPGLFTFNNSEYRAWKSGESLKKYVNGEPSSDGTGRIGIPAGYTRNVVAHSMGNFVASEALKNGMAVSNYAMLNAAVSASCYDENPSLRQWNYSTPNTDADPGTKGLAYAGRFSILNTNVINFYLINDSATLGAWNLNNHVGKPHKTGATNIEGQQVQYYGYEYWPSNAPGSRLKVTFVSEPERVLIDPHEVMPYGTRSLTYTSGAEHRTAGSIDDKVNMDALFQFGTEHGAEWDRSIQQAGVLEFYRRLLEELRITVP